MSGLLIFCFGASSCFSIDCNVMTIFTVKAPRDGRHPKKFFDFVILFCTLLSVSIPTLSQSQSFNKIVQNRSNWLSVTEVSARQDEFF